MAGELKNNVDLIMSRLTNCQKYIDLALYYYRPQIDPEPPEFGELPYIALDYIESTGTQYIDTNYIPNNNTKIIITCSDIKSVNGIPNCVLFSASTSWVYNIFALTYQEQHGILGFRWMYGEDYAFKKSTQQNKNTIELYRKSVTFNDEILVADNTIHNVNNLSTLHILGENRYSDNGYQHNMYKLHRFTILENDITIKDFIPVQWKDTSEFGLYDLQNGKFYGNSGTGTLLGN